jgi:heterotetrameric sarcosine oxidase delta subunit
MMRIPCPHCGERDAFEFTWGGQADIVRPADPNACSDEEWCAYLFIRRNPRGMHHERWCHTYGCGQWFNLWRHTVTHLVERVAAVDRAGASLQLPP